MPALILHHYETSPFSEKMRLVLGLKNLPWYSVTVPVMMPKPDVIALTGGYRRTPFLQIEADIYCDTALMCQVVDALHPTPPLYPHAINGLADIVAQWADTSLFWIAVPYTIQPASIPPDRLATLCSRPLVRAAGPPAASSSRKSERCTATRLIEPSVSTSTACHPAGKRRMT